MTWGDIKRIVLQKTFSIPDGRVAETDLTREYLAAAPDAANEGLQLLAMSGRLLKLRHDLTQEGDAPCRYDLAALLPDYYSIDADGVYLHHADGSGGRQGGWSLEGGRVLVLTGAGDWTLWYNAYPCTITAETPDEYELPLYPEAAVLLPLYIASQVYKDDDITVATQYRNEFEAGREALLIAAARARQGGRGEAWRSTTRWI